MPKMSELLGTYSHRKMLHFTILESNHDKMDTRAIDFINYSIALSHTKFRQQL